MAGGDTRGALAGRLSDVGELGFLDSVISELGGHPDLLVGPGDDCAVIRAGDATWLVTTDAQVEGTHFLPGWLKPRQLGRKAFLVGASDIAAMGGAPRFCFVTLAAPSQMLARDAVELQRGVAQAAAECGAVVAGGNVSRSTELNISVTVVGSAPDHPMLRSGAKEGDLLYVTGSLGDAALGTRLLLKGEPAGGVPGRRFREPEPRLKAGSLLANREIASAAIDVSDGLLNDLCHVCAASNVGARVESERLPASAAVRRAGRDLALSGGEDYELLFSVPARSKGRLQSLVGGLGCKVTLIGECLPAERGVLVVCEDGVERPADLKPFRHFGSGSRRHK